MNWTEEDLAAWKVKQENVSQRPKAVVFAKVAIEEPAALRGMNKLEDRYHRHLMSLLSAGVVLWFGFECLKLRLANNTFYTPDFVVIRSDGAVEIHETKGYWEEDARVKIKVAAESFPWLKFRALKWVRGTWEEESFGGRKK